MVFRKVHVFVKQGGTADNVYSSLTVNNAVKDFYLLTAEEEQWLHLQSDGVSHIKFGKIINLHIFGGKENDF